MAKDIYHKLVKEALEADGWIITDDPYSLEEWDPEWEIDLGAEKLIGATKGNVKIAVEIKSFLRPSFAYEFHQVLGQYINYHNALSELEPDRTLYLAVPFDIWLSEFQRRGIQFAVQKQQLNIILFNTDTKELIQWINN